MPSSESTSPPPDPADTPRSAAPLAPSDRRALVNTVSRLSPSDMALLVTLVVGAASHVSHGGTVYEQAAELIRWAESPTGPGLSAIREALNVS